MIGMPGLVVLFGVGVGALILAGSAVTSYCYSDNTYRPGRGVFLLWMVAVVLFWLVFSVGVTHGPLKFLLAYFR